MPQPIDTAQLSNVIDKNDLLNFKINSKSQPSLQPIQQTIIPNYDANKASEYVTDPSFNTLNPQRGYLEMENQMSQGQSSTEQWMHGVGKAVANIPLKFMEGMGYAYGLGKWGIADGFNVQHVDDMINNDFAKYFHDASKSLDQSLPIYGSFDYNEGNILQKMGTAKFWASDFTDGLAFLASAYGGSFIGKGIGKGLGAAGEGLGMSAEAAASLNKWSSFASGTIYNTVSESGFEAKDSYDSVYNDLVGKGLDPKTAKEKASQAAANTFTSNLAILTLSNAFEMKAFMGSPIDESNRLFRQIARGELSAAEISPMKQALKGAALGAISEGLYEEGMQNAIQQFQKKKAEGIENGEGFTGGYFNEWLKGFSNTEGQASMILGALIGAPFQAHSHYSEAKEKINTINFLTGEVEKQREYLKASDKIYQGFLENRYKKDNDGKIIYNDNNEPVLNEEWFKNKAFQIQLDEDYRNEKISALLKGDLSHASIVDQYYTSRKLWDYLANPLYENSDEAFKAFKDQLNTQAQEYKNISDQINQDPNSTEKDKAIANQRFAKDIQMAIANAETLKSEFDTIQKNISLDPSDPKSSYIYEKVSKALFHEATKRRVLSKLIADSNTNGLSEAAVTKLTEMLQSSEEFSNKLSNKKDRQKYIDEVKTEEEIINSKVDEFRSILDKYKEEVETQKQKTKVESLKDKGKGLLRPIISKFQRQQAEQQVAEEKPVEKKKSLQERITPEDKDKLRVLQYEISKYSYQNGKNYLSRINEAYGNEVAVGKKYQYYRELGEETIRKSKIKDSIEASMNDLSLVNSSPITPESYQRVQQALSDIFGSIQQLTKGINDDGTQTNYTSKDLEYVEQVQDQLKTLLDSIEQNIKDSLKTLKEQASEFNQYKQQMNNAIEQSINIINNLYNDLEDEYGNKLITLDFDDVNTDIYHIFGPDLLYLSFMNNYFIDSYNQEAITIKEGFERGYITRDEALTALSSIIEENSLNISENYHDIKVEAIGQLIATLPQIDLNELLDINLDINHLENIEEDFKAKDEINEKLEEIKEFSKNNVNKNKFLQLWKKDLENQDEFFESLFIEENPEFSFQVSKQEVEKYKKNFKDKNQTELDKIEDVFYYQNRLEELKDVEKILRPRSKEFKNRELHNTYGELLSLIHNLQNFIIPLAIKNQNNRKVIQQISSNIRDKSYFNQLGLNVEIDLEGNLQLKETTQKLIEEINKLYGEDIRKSKFPEKFSFLVIEKVIRDLRDKTEEELKPLHELIDTLKKEVSSEIQNFQNARGEARFKSNTIFDNYLVNPDTIIEQLIYTMSSFNDKTLRTYGEKENWFSSPLYNYSKHLSPALLLDELKKKKFSGSLNMPYDKLVDYVELHLEYSALINLENNLKSNLDFTPYYNNLKQLVNSYEFAPTYQQEIALREAYQWWNDKSMILSYLKGVAGTGKTSVFLKYFLSINNISLDNVILSAHNESAVNTLKGISTSSNGIVISDLLSKPNDFFKNTSLLVIDEINANSDKTMTDILDKLTLINKERDKDNQLKVLFMGDPTQLRVSNRPFIDYFYTHGNSFGIKYGNSLKTYSPLTVAYRSDVGSINNLANQFRDTNQVIKNIDLQSSGEIMDKDAKGAILSSNERTEGTLDDILSRLETVKEENTTKAIIVSNQDEVSKYSDEVTKRKLDNVEILTIENAQGRTFDEVYIDIVKPTLLNTNLAANHRDDTEYFYNTVMYTAISRARNLVVMNDPEGSFTHSVKEDVSDVNKDLTKEKSDLKGKINEYIDYASSFYNVEKEKPTKPTEEEKENEEIKETEIEEQEDFENDIPGTEVEITDEEEPITFIDTIIPIAQIHEIQNPEVNVLEEKEILGKKNGPSARLGNEVIYMKSADGNIYAYVEDSNSPDYYRYLTTIYPENLRNDIPTEKYLKNQYYNNTVSNLISYNKNSLNKNSVNRTHQIASGKINYTQNLQFLYEKYSNKEEIEKAIESKGGLYNYISEKLLPLITKKDSDEKYGEITDYRVFVATEQDKNQELISGITNIEFGHPYLKFKVEKTNRKGEKRIQEFFIKLEAPVLKNTDSIAAPLITFYNSINNIEQMFESINLPELKLGNNDFAKLILKFKNDFTAQVEEKLNFKNQKYDHYTIVPKEQLFVTKDDVYDVLKDYNLSDDNLSLVLATLQKESRELIPLLYSTKKDKVKVSSYGYINFLKEQVALGNISQDGIKSFEDIVSKISGEEDSLGKRINEIALNKTFLGTLNVVKSLRAFGYDLNAMDDNIVSTVRQIRRQLTYNSFVPIINGQYKGKFFAFDPLIGQVVVIDSIPDKRFVSQSYTKQQGIGMIDLEDTKLVKKNSTVQNSFNILARSNGVLNKDTDKQINIRLSYTINKSGNDVSVLFAPTLLKENKYENSFDSKYYNLLRQAFDNYVQEERRQGNKFVFDLTYQDDNGNNVDFQYKDQKNKEGKSIWKNQNVIGGFRKEASLQNENALQVMKDFLVEKGAKLLDGTTITQDVLNKLESEHEDINITSSDLADLVGPQAFDQNGNSVKGYRKNIDRGFISDTQDTTHGGKSFQDNIPLQNSVTTRFKQILPSRVQVAMNGVEERKAETKPKEKKKITRKTLNESGQYTLDHMEDDSYQIFDNGENSQELFKYDIYEEAKKKFDELTTNISVEDKKAEIERRRQEELATPIQNFKNAKTKKDLIKAGQDWIGVNPYDSADSPMGVRSALLTQGGFEKGKELFIEFFKKADEIRTKQINAKYDAEYVDAVKNGEMTKEQAIKALEEVGRKNSAAYAELKALEQPISTTQDINKIEEEIKGTSFEGLGEFSKELGGSDVESVPTDLRTINNFPVVSFSNPNTKVVDVIVSGISDNNFVGFYRLYKNGEATNIWSSKMENQSGDKKNFVGMRNAVQEMLPSSHEYTEKTSISTDGLKMWIDQLRHGYSIKRDNSGKIVTNEVAINGDSKENILGIWIKKGDFSNITITNQKDFKTAKEALIPFLEKLGLNESNIHSTNGTIEIDLPVLVYNKNKDMKSENKSNIERERQEDLLGKSFTTTTEKVVTGKGQSSGKTIVRYTESKVSSDGEVLTIKPKAKFKNEDTPLSTTPETITVKEFKQQFYENLSEQDKEMFDEIFTDDSTRIKLVEAKIGLKGSAKGQVNIDIQSLDGQPFGFELQNGKEINAKYDAKYVEAVKKGEMTKEQAIKALEEVGRKNSAAYAELKALEQQPTSTTQSEIEDEDKIIWGHPGLGKTYLRNISNDIIDFDSDYKSKINEKFGLEKGFKARNDFQKNNKEEYQKAVRELWEEAKQEAFETGKQLFASDMILLREFANDFDKVITMSKETFVSRAKQRNDYTPGAEGTEGWKQSLDTVISNVDKSKVVSTDKYLSDLLGFKGNNTVRLYRIENKNIPYDESREGIVSKKEIIGGFFTDNVDTVANYIRKNQSTEGINLVYVDILKSDLDKYHVSKNEYAKNMDVESDNWIIPQNINRNYVDLKNLTKVTGNFMTLSKAKTELSDIINNLPKSDLIPIKNNKTSPSIDLDFLSRFISEQEGFDESEQEGFNKRWKLFTEKNQNKSLEEILELASDKFNISKESLEEALKGKDLKDKC